MDLLTICFAIACTAAVVFAIEALRGRREAAAPCCRRCRFMLVGHAAAPERCPECGVKLDAPRSIRRFRRVRSGGMLVAAGAALAVLAIGAALEFGPRAAGGSWSLQTLMPTRLLVSDALTAAAPSTSLRVLTTRLASGALSDAVVRRLVAEALARQADSTIAWEPAWGRFVEAAHAQGALSDDELTRYVEQALTVEMKFEPAVKAGHVHPTLLVSAARAGDAVLEGAAARCRVAAVTVGGSEPVRPRARSWGRSGGSASIRFHSDDWCFTTDLPAGEHEVVVDWRLDIDPTALADPATRRLVGALPAFARMRRTVGRATTIAADLDAAQLFAPVEDPRRLDEVARALEAGLRIRTYTRVRPAQVHVMLDAGACPAAIDATFELVLGDGRVVVPREAAVRVAGRDLGDPTRLGRYTGYLELDGIPPGRFTARLRPNDEPDPRYWRWVPDRARPIPLVRRTLELRDFEIKSDVP